jgi:hypothetical protein
MLMAHVQRLAIEAHGLSHIAQQCEVGHIPSSLGARPARLVGRAGLRLEFARRTLLKKGLDILIQQRDLNQLPESNLQWIEAFQDAMQALK